MNERFYHLPKEKQQKIINAGFRVFSRNLMYANQSKKAIRIS